MSVYFLNAQVQRYNLEHTTSNTEQNRREKEHRTQKEEGEEVSHLIAPSSARSLGERFYFRQVPDMVD